MSGRIIICNTNNEGFIVSYLHSFIIMLQYLIPTCHLMMIYSSRCGRRFLGGLASLQEVLLLGMNHKIFFICIPSNMIRAVIEILSMSQCSISEVKPSISLRRMGSSSRQSLPNFTTGSYSSMDISCYMESKAMVVGME